MRSAAADVGPLSPAPQVFEADLDSPASVAGRVSRLRVTATPSFSLALLCLCSGWLVGFWRFFFLFFFASFHFFFTPMCLRHFLP